MIEDGRVYVHFGSYGTAALDTRTGRRCGPAATCRATTGAARARRRSSTASLLIVHFDGYDQQYAVALDKQTGRTVWKSDRTHDFDTDDGDMKKAYATPVVIEAAGRQQLISQAAKAVLSLDPKTGRELWRVRYASHSAAARPLFAHGLLYVGTGRGPSELLAIRPDGQGDVTDTHVAWRAARGIGSSPVSDPGGRPDLQRRRQGRRRDLPRREDRAPSSGRSGPARPPTRLPRCSRTAPSTSSPKTARRCCSRPAATYRELGRARLGEGGVMATPAIAGQALFLRTESHLYRIETRP